MDTLLIDICEKTDDAQGSTVGTSGKRSNLTQCDKKLLVHRPPTTKDI